MSYKSPVLNNYGTLATDFYFKYTSAWSKYYYSKITGGRVGVKQIDPKIVPDIKIFDAGLDVAELLRTKAIYEKEMEKIKKKIAEIDLKLKDIPNINEYELERKKREEDAANEKRKKEFAAEQKKRLDDLFRQASEAWNKQREAANKRNDDYLRDREKKKEEERQYWREYFKARMDSTQREPEKDILKELNINNKKEWKEWLLKNHPDKGGSLSKCQEVIYAGRARGW